MAATIAVEALMETKRMRSGIDQINGQLGSMQKAGQKAGKVMRNIVGGAAVVFGVQKLGGALKDMVSEARESQKVNALTANTIKATGGVANVTAKQVGNLATAISNKTGIDDEAIQAGSNLLLTFKNVRNEAGKGNKVFNEATKAAVDLSASGFGSIEGSSKMLGKALNDPTKGISALGRAGVTFTDQQKQQIKTLQASGKTLQAQKMILKEVKSQVGGNAAAAATSGEKFQTMVANIKESIGTKMLPILDKVQEYMVAKLPAWIGTAETAFGKIQYTFQSIQPAIGTTVNLFKNFGPALLAGATAWFAITKGIAAYKAITTAVKTAQIALNLAMTANPIGLIVVGIAALVAGLVLMYQHSSKARAIMQGAFKGILAVGKALWTGLKAAFAGIKVAVQIAGKAVSLYLLPARTALKLLIGAAKAVLPGVKSAFGSVITFVKGIPGKITGAFSGAKTMLSGIGGSIVDGLTAGIRAAAGKVMDAVDAIVGKIPKFIRKRMGIASPSKVTTQLGKYISQGLAKGIGLGSSSITKAVDKLADLLNDRLPKKIKGKKAIAKWYKEHNKDIKAGTKAVLKSLADDAKARYAALKAQSDAYAAEVANAAKGYAALSNLTLGENENLTAGGIKQYLTDRLAVVKNFTTKLKALASKGISKDLYAQIAGMGVEQGTAYAEALSSATPQALKEINNLQSQIGAASNTLGAATAKTMYGDGVNAAKGFYNGLKSMLAKIVKTGGDLGKSLVKALKKALGIKSPSRVFAAIGKQTIAGLDIGLDDKAIRNKGQSLAKALQTGFKSPQLDAQLAAGFANSGQQKVTNIYEITVRLDSSMTEIEMGRAYRKAIRAAEKAGM